MNESGEERRSADLAAAVRDAMTGILISDMAMIGKACGFIAMQGPGGVNAAFYAWSSITLKGMGERSETGEGVWAIDVTDVHTGEKISIDQYHIPSAYRDAVRLVALYGNEDHDMIAAITEMYWKKGPSAMADLMLASAGLAANVARVLDEAAREGK